MDELTRLIKEQAADMAMGQVQRPQPRTVPLAELEVFLQDTGNVPTWKLGWRDPGAHWECPVHGREFLRLSSPSSAYPTYCTRCGTERTRLWRTVHRDEYRRKHREYQRRHRAEHPEHYAELNARRRAAYAARKGQEACPKE